MFANDPVANAGQQENDVADSLSAEVQDLHDRLRELEDLVKQRPSIAEESFPNSDDSETGSAETSRINKRIESVLNDLSMVKALDKSDEFDKRFLASIRNELQNHIFKMGLATIVLMCGAGYLLLQNAVHQTFDKENQARLNEFEREYDRKVRDWDDAFEWRRYHDYGRHMIYLARLHYATPGLAGEDKVDRIKDLFDNAEDKFEQALTYGKPENHASTYWELAELRYEYPKEWGIDERVKEDEALSYYHDAEKYYSPSEIEKGWRADAYNRMGHIYWAKSERTNIAEEEEQTCVETSVKYLKKALAEYIESDKSARSSERVEERMDEVRRLLVKIREATKSRPQIWSQDD